jgi:hypothetical protein
MNRSVPLRYCLAILDKRLIRVAASLLLLGWISTSCGPSATLNKPAFPFPPKTAEELQSFVRSRAPIDTPATASNIFATRIPRASAIDTNLATFFVAFRCSREEAMQTIGVNSSLDNSIIIDPVRVSVTNAAPGEVLGPIVLPNRIPSPPVYPDVFYEGRELGEYRILRIRVDGAPSWFTPQMIQRGIADRCLWKRGQILVEFYFDDDRQLMFLRFDELREK